MGCWPFRRANIHFKGKHLTKFVEIWRNRSQNGWRNSVWPCTCRFAWLWRSHTILAETEFPCIRISIHSTLLACWQRNSVCVSLLSVQVPRFKPTQQQICFLFIIYFLLFYFLLVLSPLGNRVKSNGFLLSRTEATSALDASDSALWLWPPNQESVFFFSPLFLRKGRYSVAHRQWNRCEHIEAYFSSIGGRSKSKRFTEKNYLWIHFVGFERNKGKSATSSISAVSRRPK